MGFWAARGRENEVPLVDVQLNAEKWNACEVVDPSKELVLLVAMSWLLNDY